MYILDTGAAAPSSVVAFVSTVHAALLVIHVQRVRGPWRPVVALPAAGFAAFAWILAAPAWLAAGLIAHAAWTVTALKWASAPLPRTAGAASATGQLAAAPASNATLPSFVPATVLAVVDEAKAIRTFRLSRPPGFTFEPGQFLMVKVGVGGQSTARCYSISSPPAAAGFLEISVKRQGAVSSALHDTVRPGDTLLVHPPLGRFTVPAGSEDLVLVAGGIGITPLISVIRHTVAAEPSRRVTLLYSAKDHADVAFHDELAWLQRRYPQLRVAITLTGAHTDGWRHGRIDADFIRDTVPDLSTSVFLICGPLPMIGGVREMLAALGVSPARVHFEAFEAAVAIAAQERAPEAAAGRLRLTVTGCETKVEPSETLLEAAERAGARIASFCRSGICGTCRTRLLSGNVRCAAEALSSAEREQGYVLPCVARPTSDCALEA